MGNWNPQSSAWHVRLVIWNSVTRELFGACDHFGVKPFYCTTMHGTFMYASEIKGLLQHPDFVKKLNAQALKPFMTFQYPALDETFLKGVFKLNASHYFTHRNDTMDIHEYWNPAFVETKQSLSDLIDSIDATVKDSIAHHQIADIGVESFLSSGVDSSYVASAARPEHTYSVGFCTGAYNESRQAKELADLIGLNDTTEELGGMRDALVLPADSTVS